MKEKDLYKLMRLPQEIQHSGAVELKMVKKGRFEFAAVREHQVKALLRCQERQLLRFDDHIGGFGSQLPYDYNFIVQGVGYVAVCFYVPRKPKRLIWIRIRDFLDAKYAYQVRLKGPKKSMSEEECLAISTLVQVL